MTTIGWIRHGVTDWNMDSRAQGQTDIPLNAAGSSQAELLAQRLQHDEWDIIYTSDLSRARETAAILSAVTGLEVRTDVRLRERCFGEIEGTTIAERIQRWGANWKELHLGMEDRDEVIKRGRSLLHDIEDEFPNQKVLLISHIAYIRIMLQELASIQDQGERLENTSLTVLKRSGDRWICELFNSAEHLQESKPGGTSHI